MQIHMVQPRHLSDIEVELLRLGVADTDLAPLADRGLSRTLRVAGLAPAAAKILRDSMEAAGGTAAMPLDADSTDSADVLLMGPSDSFLRCIASLKTDAPELSAVAVAISEVLSRVDGSSAPAPVMWPDGPMTFGDKTYIMGIINCTPDSFYDGGRNLALETAMDNARKMVADGVDIIDVGGESTRPGSDPVPLDEEINRTVPFIKEFKKEFPATRISIDTTKAGVASAALEAGAALINDISGLRADPDMKRLAADSGAPVCIMHMRGTPGNMQDKPSYPGDVCYEINSFFREQIADAAKAGVQSSQIILDPGIGFGKSVEHNLEILSRLSEFRAHGLPILMGASRKSFIGKTLALESDDRLEGSLAAAVLSVSGGADIVRVHDVCETVRAVRLADAVVRKRRMLEKTSD